MANERTPLRRAEGAGPPYVFMTNPNKLYRKQIHQFQCFICSLFLLLFTTAVVISVLRSVEEDTIDNPPSPLIFDNSSIEPLLSMSWPIDDKGVPDWQGDMPNEDDVVIALIKGQQSLQAKDELEKSTKPLSKDTASYKHQKSIKTSPRAQYLSRTGYVMDVATKTVISKGNNTNGKNKKTSIGRTLRLKEVPPLPAFCSHDKDFDCEQTEYRSVDGSCNNIKHPSTWGVAMQPFRRILPPDYADGVSSPRTSSGGTELPSAREVSVVIHRPEYRDDPKFTVMLAVWGQFLDHDISATALSQGKDGSTISCCDIAEEQRHPECFPVRVGSGDPYFNVSCLEFVRSAPAPICSFGPREQLNQASSYIDGSVVYGNTQELSSSLRSYQSGQLRMTVTEDGRELLPISTDPNDGCNREEESSKGRYCFASGDARANENMHLTTMHLIMARQHNNLASQLAVLNPTWNDERIYQESRKIVAAQMQHITYNEFLPVLIGPQLLDRLDLLPEASGYSGSYDDKVDASVGNSFATASFRFAHTLLPGVMKLFHNSSKEEKVELHNMLFNPYKLYSPGYIDSAVLGAINTPLERMDNYFNKEVTEKLFKQPNKTCGLDLVSLNVQRGRDHGLPAYPEWREHCGLSKPTSFDDLKGLVDDESLKRISELYKTVDDVDLYTGALSEYPLESGMLGATLTCLIGDQFMRLKIGDRYWYETSEQPQAFTPEQLAEIRKTSLAQLICDNADNVTVIQPRVMESIREGNTRVSCDKLEQPNLVHWTNFGKQKSIQKNLVSEIEKQTIAVKVKSGFISSDDSSNMWDGSFPLIIPTKYFSHKKFAPENFDNDLAYEAFVNLYKIQWNGKLSKADGKLMFSGTFTFPYLDFSVPFSPSSLKSINGKFLFLCDSIWNNTDAIDLSGSYSSPIFFSEKSFNLTNVLQFVQVHPHLTSLLNSTEKVPIILNGSYSLDSSSFSWDGNALIRLPLQKVESIDNKLKISNMKSNQTTVGFKVTNGNIKLTSADGFQETIWSGNFPVDMSNPIFHLKEFSRLQAESPGSDVSPELFQYGITWTLLKSGPKYQGKFTMPLYNYTKGYSIIWMNGEFDLDVLSTSEMTMENAIEPGMKYVSRVIFREEKIKSLPSDTDSMESNDQLENLKLFLADSASAIDGAVPAPIILDGSFSPDKKIFHWSGEGAINIRSNKKYLLAETIAEQSSPIWTESRYGCSVQGGFIKDVSGREINLTPPIDIPMASIWSHDKTVNSFSYSSGINWSGILSGNVLKGSFSFPQFGGDPVQGPFVQWKNGTFSFQLQPLWDSELESLLMPGGNYFSKIAFQGSSSALDTSSNYKMSNELSSTIYAPIILQGQYSLTKDVFTWNGNLIISFRGSMNRNYNFVTDKKVLQLTDSKPGKTSSRIKISTGSLSAGSTTQEMPPVMWEGDFPVKIDVDSLLPPNTFIRSAEVTWSGEISSTNLNGVFSVPIYDKKGISTLYTGNFSFDYTTAWSQTVDTLLKANKKYVAKVFFSDSRKKSNYAENSNIETSSSVSVNSANKQNLGAGSSGLIISLLGYYYSKPFFCPGFICNNEKLFYWSGDAIISVANQQFVLQKSTMFTQASMQFGGRVIHGQLNIHNSKNEQKVWEGMLPAEIPTELMMMPQAKKMFVEWYGNYSESILQGVFTIPEYEMFNSTLNLMGDFKLMIEPLWFASLENILVSGRKYVSQIYLQGDEKFAENNYKLGEDTLIFVPIILQGDYSADKKVFLWNGNFIISVRTPSKPANEETVRLMAIKDSYVTLKPTKSPKPTKAPKPTKPPKPPSPIKLSVSLTVISGLVSAGFENMNATEVWNGAPPVSMTLDNVLEEESYTTSAQATWSGTVDKTNFEGTFSVPTTFKNETDTTTVEWKGSFSVKYMVKWSGNLESFVKPGKKLTCKVLFKEFGQKSTNPNSITNDNYSNESFKKQKASKPEIDIDSLGPPTACNIILVGTFYKKPFYCKILPFFCTDSTIFTWNGEAILSYSFPPPVTTTPKPEDRITVTESPLNELKLSMGVPFTPYYTHQRVVIGKVVSGYMKAGLSGESKKMLWSGSVPTVIPFPVFWAPVSTLPDTPPDAYSHGVIWSGSAFGSTVDCSFKLPQYISNGAGSSMRWWNGNLRVHIQSLWTTGIGGLIIPGVKYYSRVVFRESKKYSETNQLTPTQDEINSAYEAPLILLGNYSADRKMFYWSGNFILVFRDLPSPYTYDLPPAAISTISDPNTDKKPLKQVMDGSKDSSLVLAKQKSIVAKVLTGTIVAGLSPLSKQTIWSGALPAEIPLSVFWLPSIDLESVDTDSYSHGVIWSGAVFGNTVQCSFYLPQHTLVEKSAGIRWWKGDMSLKIESAWDIGLAQMIAPGLQYSSRVSFGDEKNITKLLTSAPSQDKIDSSFKAPITLIGKYSPDKKTFYWSGSFVIKFHSIPGTFMNELMMPIDSQNMKQLKFIKKTSISDSSLRKNLAVIVKSGFVTKIGVGNDRVNLWSGEMPTTIPLMNVSSNMIVNWTGSIQDSVLLGEYSTFEVMKGQLFSGQFSLNIDPMWNSTFDAFIAAGKSFTSKLIMRELHMPSLVSLSASAESDVPLGAIILLGQYSPDRSFFTWFGQAIVNVY